MSSEPKQRRPQVHTHTSVSSSFHTRASISRRRLPLLQCRTYPASTSLSSKKSSPATLEEGLAALPPITRLRATFPSSTPPSVVRRCTPPNAPPRVSEVSITSSPPPAWLPNSPPAMATPPNCCTSSSLERTRGSGALAARSERK